MWKEPLNLILLLIQTYVNYKPCLLRVMNKYLSTSIDKRWKENENIYELFKNPICQIKSYNLTLNRCHACYSKALIHRVFITQSVSQLSVSHRKSSPLRIIFTTCLLCVLLPTSRPLNLRSSFIMPVSWTTQTDQVQLSIETFVAGKSLFSLLQSFFTIGRRRSPSRVWLELRWEGAYSWLSSWSGSWSGSRGSGRRTRRWWRRRRSSRAAGGGRTSCPLVTTSNVIRPRQEIRKKYLPSMWENRMYVTLNFEQRV